MQSVICTLFEGDYHLGVATLVNSLYKHGYRGAVYAGYKGKLPPWIQRFESAQCCKWEGCKTIAVAERLTLHFLPLQTEYHLTNFKPDFLLKLWDIVVPEATALFYFDPDIVIVRPWSIFDDWVKHGVALCEDINSPLPKNHPRRKAWRNYFREADIHLSFKDTIYANGGFIGVAKDNIEFVKNWQQIQQEMGRAIGGLNNSMFADASLLEVKVSPFAPFSKTDQDALNAAVELWENDISFVGKEGMGFGPGTALMLHALGYPKPWNYKPLKYFMRGIYPRHVDKLYWNQSDGIFKLYPKSKLLFMSFQIELFSFLSRFYGRRS